MFLVPAYPSGLTKRLRWLLAVFSLPLLSAQALPPRPALPPLRVKAVAPDVFVHTSYRRLPGSAAPVPANGLIVRTAKGALLIDTTWDPEQTQQLLQWIADSLHQRVQLAIITHAHEDRAGGLAVLQAQRIKVYSTPLTAQRFGMLFPRATPPTPALKPYTLIRAGRTRLELFFPGAAHAPDNVVAWLPRQKVLFGGCLVREQSAPTLGNLDDANLSLWPASLRTVTDRYPRAQVVVPGHGQWGGPTLLTHTAELLREANRRKPPTALREPQANR
ncbi:subclass B1 metallo-beta-lactamase [Hymenobacter sediminis]|uniref:subclass B1 metallo-beta-lactamase n=1 Tax=Hymenobacter sediminis TaxID=2218621 RepID=UPI000DA6B23B|nr:subclass B1 metallo-beta-lactamase [Hymenobacter sediminis]RPD49654.1 subclass B1 metallo-beta-lactamase [Hymenobacter sediminis]